jgi:hypothetical protein
MATEKPDLRTFKALLSTIKASGLAITEYEDATGLKLKFGDQSQPQQADAMEDADPNRDLELPDGVVDPVKVLERINRRKAAS